MAEAKLWLRLDHSAEDALVTSLIQVVRQAAEERGLALVDQTWELALDAFPAWAIQLSKAPLKATDPITSIKYTDTAGVLQTLDSALYAVDQRRSIPEVTPAYGQSWPSTRKVSNAVVVRFIAGYGSGGTPGVPERVLHAMRVALTTAYTMRGEFVAGAVTPTDVVARCLANYELFM